MAYRILGREIRRVGSEQHEILDIQTDVDPVADDCPATDNFFGSSAHTTGYGRIWELGPEGWVEL
jgi:hypothetical protein